MSMRLGLCVVLALASTPSVAGEPTRVSLFTLHSLVTQSREQAVVPIALPGVGEVLLALDRFVDTDRGWAASGFIGDSLADHFYFLMRDDLLGGFVNLDGKTYQFRPLPERGLMAELHVTDTAPIDCGWDPASAAPEITPSQASDQRATTIRTHSAPTMPAAPPAGICWPCADDGSHIDVLVVYTPAALAENNGDPAIMEFLAEFGIEFTNVVMSNSGAQARLRLVSAQLIDYDELGPTPYSPTDPPASVRRGFHHRRLRGTEDGFMDEVHEMRDNTRADLVQLIHVDPAAGGGAANFATWWVSGAFSVIHINGVRSPDGVAHEFGHNFGFHHGRGSRGNRDTDTRFEFNFAHIFETPQGEPLETIMASLPDRRSIPFYSNPNITSHDVPIGIPLEQDDAAYNALVADMNRFSLANHRPSGDPFDCDDDGEADSDQILRDGSLDANENGLLDSCEQRIYVNQSAAEPGNGFSWDEPRTELRSAIESAAPPCSLVTSVWIAEGTYLSNQGVSDDRTRRFWIWLRNSELRILGGFAGDETDETQRDPMLYRTVLSGEIDNDGESTNNTWTILTITDSSRLVIDGVTIRDGYSDGAAGGALFKNASATFRNVIFENNIAAASTGGAVRLVPGSSAIFDRCQFITNSSRLSRGGAISCWASDVIVTDSEFVGNTARNGAGIAATVGSNLFISGCSFRDNVSESNGGVLGIFDDSVAFISDTEIIGGVSGASGGAIAFDTGGSGQLSRVLLAGNTAVNGGAIWISGSSTLDIGTSILTGNSASRGGAIYATGSLSMWNSLVADNRATGDWGGGIWAFDDGLIDVRDSTIVNNHAETLGGGLLFRGQRSGGDGDLYVANTIIAGNTQVDGNTPSDLDVIGNPDDAVIVRYSLIQQQLFDGEGNLTDDPGFIDPNTDFHLAPGSQAIDAADNFAVALDIFDLDGDGDFLEPIPFDLDANPRFTDDPATDDTGVGPPPIVDMGAYEFPGNRSPQCPADLDGDADADADDFFFYLDAFATGDLNICDIDQDGDCDGEDFFAYLDLFAAGC